jgi:hypothetical protein
MPKTQALIYAALCGGVGLLCSLVGLGILTSALIVLGGLFGCLWMYKFIRDRNIIVQANNEALKGERRVLEPPVTSPGSRILKVPAPLDRR